MLTDQLRSEERRKKLWLVLQKPIMVLLLLVPVTHAIGLQLLWQSIKTAGEMYLNISQDYPLMCL